jgi:hypothetical protein
MNFSSNSRHFLPVFIHPQSYEIIFTGGAVMKAMPLIDYNGCSIMQQTPGIEFISIRLAMSKKGHTGNPHWGFTASLQVRFIHFVQRWHKIKTILSKL